MKFGRLCYANFLIGEVRPSRKIRIQYTEHLVMVENTNLSNPQNEVTACVCVYVCVCDMPSYEYAF